MGKVEFVDVKRSVPAIGGFATQVITAVASWCTHIPEDEILYED